MNGITTATALDLATTTLNELGRGSFTSTLRYQSYPLAERLFGRRLKNITGGATGAERRIRLRENETARGTRMYATKTYRQTDLMATLLFPWVRTTADYVTEVSEMRRNKGGARIVDLIKTRREGAYESLANYFETRGFTTPDTPTDDLNPMGLLGHIVPLATGQVDPVGGFNGVTTTFGDGQTSTLIGGLDRNIAANSRLRNWAFSHDGAITPALIRQLRTAIARVGFRAPSGWKLGTGADTTQQRSSMFTIFWNQILADAYADYVNNGPDDRNGNASPFFGDLPFGPVDTVGTPALDGVARSPILGVNFGQIEVAVCDGAWMVENEPMVHPEQHTTLLYNIDCEFTIRNHNPRAHFVGCTVS